MYPFLPQNGANAYPALIARRMIFLTFMLWEAKTDDGTESNEIIKEMITYSINVS
jgi:hypothetical protein